MAVKLQPLIKAIQIESDSIEAIWMEAGMRFCFITVITWTQTSPYFGLVKFQHYSHMVVRFSYFIVSLSSTATAKNW